MFSISPFIQNVGGRIHFSDSRVGEDFRDQVQDWRFDPIAVCSGRFEGESELAARVFYPVQDSQPHTAILTFRGRVGGKDVSGVSKDWAKLSRLFGLTPAEKRVALRLTTGDSAANIAIGLGVSVDTVRSHSQKIYAKVGVTSREQLTARLAPLCFSSLSADDLVRSRRESSRVEWQTLVN